MDIEIKAGQTWLTRGGKTFTISEITDKNGLFPVRSDDRYWMANGRYWADDHDHSKDFIKQIS